MEITNLMLLNRFRKCAHIQYHRKRRFRGQGRILILLQENGRMSQKELAEQSGVSQTTISHFEQGVSRNLTLANFISLLRALGQAERLAEILPELPMPPMALREIEKLIPKRVRRGKK